MEELDYDNIEEINADLNKEESNVACNIRKVIRDVLNKLQDHDNRLSSLESK